MKKDKDFIQNRITSLKMDTTQMQQRFLYFPHHIQNFLLEDDIEKIGSYIDTKEINHQYGDEQYTILMMICRHLKCSEDVNNNLLSMFENFFKKMDCNTIHIPLGIEKIEWLLNNGADLNKQNEDGYTTLTIAACESSPERGQSSEKVIEILLAAGANPNIQDKLGMTSLMFAASNSSPERGTSSERIVEILLAAGADPNIQSITGITALILSACHSSRERGLSSPGTIEILLANGADPNKQSKSGWTALMFVARYGSFHERIEDGISSEKIIKILLDNGADPKMITNRGKTAEDLAHENVKKMIKKYMLVKKWKIPRLINNGKPNGCVCHICDDNNKDVVLTCGHTFCIECIEKILESQKCPDCREAFTENDIQQFIL